MTESMINDIFLIRIKKVEKKEWIQYSSMFNDYNYRQIWDYGLSLAQRRKTSSEHVAVFNEERLIGIADVRVKKVPMLRGGLAYVSGGPLTIQAEGFTPEHLTFCLRALRLEYVQNRGMILRIAPPLRPADQNYVIARCFEKVGFSFSKKAPAYRTFLLNIDRKEEEIRFSRIFPAFSATW
jgi:hypothetical protein